MFTLTRFSPFPPGGFRYEQTEGIYRKFKGGRSIEEQAHRVAAFRSANNLPRSSYLEALQDIDAYTCARLNNSPQFCRDVESYAQAHPTVFESAGCSSCGKVKT